MNVNKLYIAFLIVCVGYFGISLEAVAQKTVVVVPIFGDGAGDAVEADVLEGKTFSSDAGKGLTGIMPHVGQQVVVPTTTNQNITQGYHDGSGYALGDDDLTADKIKSGVDIFGVTGNYVGGTENLAPVPKTGQTTCYKSPGILIPCSDPEGVGQDGDLQAGVAWPDPRFSDNGDGTVRDNLTGLIWLKNANCSGSFPGVDGKMNRASALGFVAALNLNQLLTNCGDTSNNGNTQNDWRLPNRFELESLLDLSQGQYALPDDIPALPVGHPFNNVEVDDYYWSSSFSSYFKGLGVGWAVSFSGGDVTSRSWAVHSAEFPSHSYVWPVRGGTH